MKDNKTSLKKNIIYQMLFEILILCVPLITSPYISRILGAEQLGIYSYTYSIVTYFGMACMLGIYNYGNREIAKCCGDKDKISYVFSSIFYLHFFISLVIFFGYVLFMVLSNSEYKLYYFCETAYIVSCIININWLFLGLEQFKFTVFRGAIVKILSLVLIFALVRTKNDLWKYCLILTGSEFLNQAIMWMYLPRFAKFVKVKREDVMSRLRPLLILFIPVLAVSLYNIMDKIMVGGLSTKSQLGYYENSEKIINCCKTVITSFGTVMLPRMSRLVAEQNKKTMDKYMSLSADGIMFISFALAFGIAAVANVFSPIYWGSDFSECGSLMIGLAVSLPMSAVANYVRSQCMIPYSLDKYYIYSVATGAIVNLITNYFLIPFMGAMGAVIGTVLAEGSVCIIQCILVRKIIPIIRYLRRGTPFLLFGISMWVVIYWLQQHGTPSLKLLICEILVGAFIYCICSLIYFWIVKNPILVSLLYRFNKVKKD